MSKFFNDTEERVSLLASTRKEAKEPRENSANIRWILVVVGGILIQGSVAVYEIPIFMLGTLHVAPYSYSYTKFNGFFAISALSSALAPFIQGPLINKFGFRYSKILLVCLIWIGQLLFFIGVTQSDTYLSYLGRFLIGSFETLLAVFYFQINHWFNKAQLVKAIGLFVTVSKIGTAANLALSPYIFELSADLLAPALIVLAVVFFNLIILGITASIGEIRQEEKREVEQASSGVSDPLPVTFWLSIANVILITLSMDCTYYQLNHLISSRFGFSSALSGYLSLIVVGLGGLIFQIRVRKRYQFSVISALALVIAHALFAYLPLQEHLGFRVAIPLVFLAITYSGFELELWLSLVANSENKQVHSALSWSIFVQKIVFAVSFIVIGVIQDQTDAGSTFVVSETILMGIAIVATVSSVLHYVMDKRKEESSV